MRLFGTKLANELNSEARVFAGLLGNRCGAYDPTVVYHSWANETKDIETFRKISRAEVVTMDFGWRPTPIGRSVTRKIASMVQFQLALLRLLPIARAVQPDVIYSCQQKWDCYAASYIARRLRKPQVIHLHYPIGPWLGNYTLRRLKACNHIVAVSDFIRSRVLEFGITPDKTTTVANTMPILPPVAPGIRERLRAEWGISNSAPVIGLVARIDPGKGVDDTIAAFQMVALRFPEARLIIVGDGAERPALERQVAQAGNHDRIIFTGKRDDVLDVLALFNVFAHPSRYDPAPLSILEAMASGLPIVAYKEGGVCDFVATGETGFLAPPGDVSGLASAFDTLLSDLDLAREMGEASRERCATHFQPEASGRKLSEILHRVAGVV
jgi:glycosyltransferase involved in cell wall biosynthesis